MMLPNAVTVPIDARSAAPADWKDWLGIVASFGCAVHCAAMPFVIASLPALGLSFLADEAFHRWMAAICFAIALAAFLPGLRRHRRVSPAAIGVVGLSMIFIAAFGLAGPCCESCTAGTATDASRELSMTADRLFMPAGGVSLKPAAESSVVCNDVCCEHCAASAAQTQPRDSLDVNLSGIAGELTPSPLLYRFAAWLTPIGGLFLVVAHLLNRRFSCRCGCCEIPSA